MAANTTLPQGAAVQPAAAPATRPVLQPVHSHGPLAGLRNMLDKELGEWFRTRRWLIQLLVWVGLIDGFVAFGLWMIPELEKQAASQGQQLPGLTDPLQMGLSMFFSLLVQAGTIGVVILAQDEIVGEKQTGTAAWVLSKPASRAGFILSKLIANTIGILVFVVAVPAVVGYALIALGAGAPPDLPHFLLGLGPAVLVLLFYLALTLVLGVLFSQRGPVLGISFGLLFGLMILASLVPQLGYALPMQMQAVAQALAQGMPLPPQVFWMLGSTAAWIVVFVVVALWRFQRQEL